MQTEIPKQQQQQQPIETPPVDIFYELPEQLLVLKSIYPEIQLYNHNKALSLEIPLYPENPIELRLIREKEGPQQQTVKVIQTKTSNYVTGLNFYAELPVSLENYVLSSGWIKQETLAIFSAHIHGIIQRNIDDDCQDSTLYEIIDYLKIDLTTSSEQIALICENYQITTSSQDRFNQISNMFHEAKLSNFSSSRFSCSICLETQEGTNGVILPNCDHTFCKPCLNDYFTNIISQGDVLKLQCPNCPIEAFSDLGSLRLSELKTLLFGREFPKSILYYIGLEETTVEKYIKLVTNSIFDKIKIHFPFASSLCPRCDRWIIRDNMDDKLVQCRQCHYNYCFICLHSWHGNFNACGKRLNAVPEEVIVEILKSPEDVKMREKYEGKYGKRALEFHIKEYEADLDFKNYLEESTDIVRCPSCAMAISKTDGCNRMKCTSCTGSFCYLCLSVLDKANPYEHYTIEDGSPCRGRLFEGLIGAD